MGSTPLASVQLPTAPLLTAPSRWRLLAVSAGAVAVVSVATVRGPTTGVLAVAAVGMGLAVARRRSLLGVCLVALVPALGGLHRGFPVPGLRLSEVLLILGGLVLLAGVRSAPPWRAFERWLLAYALASATLATYHTVLSAAPLSAEAVKTVVSPFFLLLLSRVVVTAFPGERERAWAARVMVVAAIPVTLVAAAQKFGPAAVNHTLAGLTGSIVYGQTSTSVPRASGPFPIWHVLGGYLLISALLTLALLLQPQQQVASRKLLGLSLVASCAGIALSVTLAVTVALVGGAILLVAWSKGHSKALVAIVIGAAGAAVAFAPLYGQQLDSQYATAATSGSGSLVPQTISYRFKVWQRQYAPELAGRWIAGASFTRASTVSWPFTESMYLTLLLRGGFLLLIPYCGMLVSLWLVARGNFLDPRPLTRALARTAAAAALLFGLIQFIFPYFDNVAVPQQFICVAALLLAATAPPPARPFGSQHLGW